MINKALKTLFVVNGIFVFASGLLGPLYAIFVETIDRNVVSVSISWSVFLFASTIFVMFIRKYGDLVQEKEYLLMAGFLLRAVVWFAYPHIGSLSVLIAVQILLGLGEALGTPAYDAIFAEHLDKNRHIEEYADWKLISNLAGAAAVLMGGFVVQYVGFSALFTSMGVLAVIAFFAVFFQSRKLL